MIETLHHLITPLATLVFALWAAWLSFAEEADADVPRLLADQQQGDGRRLPKSRALYVGHLALLILSGASAGAAISWWVFQPVGAIGRLLLGVLLVWVVGGVLPRVLAAIAPELPPLVRPAALRSLRAFGPLLRLIAWADLKFRPPTPPVQHRESVSERRDMLLGLFALSETTVAEVMTPRIDIVGVDSGAEREEVIATLLRSEHARILVYDGHIDGIVGVLHAKDLLAGVPGGDEDEWHSFIRPAAFVPEGKSLDRQLRDFQRGPSHLAVVVDEFGGTAGLVTLEDILEQVVGEIQDEHDTDETQPVIEQAEGRLSVEGGVALGELEGLLGHSFHREDVSTVGGLVLDAFGRVPRVGERIEIDGIELVVEQVARRRVRRIVLTRPVAPVEEPVEGVT